MAGLRHSATADPPVDKPISAPLSATSPAGAPNWAEGRKLLLDVVVNGFRIGKIGDFEERGGTLYGTRHELEDLGFKPGAGDADELLKLSALPATQYRVDEASQTIYVEAASRVLKPTLLGPTRAVPTPQAAESGTGAVLNYDLNSTYAGARLFSQALLDGRVFSPWGVLSSGLLAGSGRVIGGGNAVRLDTTYTWSDADTMRRVRAGDTISSGLAWSRPVRLAGVQLARDFGLRPDLVTFPVPSIAGQVAVPSTVDVVINGVQQFSASANPGPFELRQLPVTTGANSVNVVINDATGRHVQETLPFYTSSTMLAEGLDAYSAEVGSVRLGYGLRSDDYHSVAASGSYRRGVANWLTASTHGEATPELAMFGVGASVALGSWGAVSVAAAGSTGRSLTGQGSGVLGYAAFERIAPSLSLSASIQWTDGGFRDIAAIFGDPVPRRVVQAGIGVPIGKSGSLAVSYTKQVRAQQAPTAGVVSSTPDTLLYPSYTQPVRISLLSASYTTPVFDGRAFLFVSGFRDFENRSNSGLLFGVTLPLGARSSVSANAGLSSGNEYGALQYSRSAVEVGDVGAQGYAGFGANARLLALGQYKSSAALLEAGADRTAGHTTLRASANGAIVLADGHLFASNTINDSFAVVNTGSAGVLVTNENRPVQRSGASGRVLVPDLRSYDLNHLGIDPSDLPLDAEIADTSKVVRPQDRSGVVVEFAVRRLRAALLRLVEQSGQPVPVSSQARLVSSGQEVPVGFDGEVYLRNPAAHDRVFVALPGGGTCSASFDFEPEQGGLRTIGPLVCAPAR